MTWKDIYANYITFIQIFFELLICIYILSDSSSIQGSAFRQQTYFVGSLFVKTWFIAIISISILFRLKCRKLLNNFDIKAYRILYFYHFYWYIIFGWIMNGIVILFFIWSLPNLIYFRKIKNQFINPNQP